ncbi:MAG: transcriptional repressor [Clostridiales bacterium]|jgi:Fe2+ or Zn2+ uptake regulation protein|nr:transcriptional repressor [Clostridiales bacterium]
MKAINDQDLLNRIKESGIRPSYVRLLILNYLEEHSHPTADQIYTDLREVMPTLSQASVYNTVSTFQEAGLIQFLGMNGPGVHYDSNPREHAHFQCRECGEIYDFDLPDFDCTSLEGFYVQKKDLRIWGICPKCSILLDAQNISSSSKLSSKKA